MTKLEKWLEELRRVLGGRKTFPQFASQMSENVSIKRKFTREML